MHGTRLDTKVARLLFHPLDREKTVRETLSGGVQSAHQIGVERDDLSLPQDGEFPMPIGQKPGETGRKRFEIAVYFDFQARHGLSYSPRASSDPSMQLPAKE